MGSGNDLLVADQEDRIAFSTPVIIIEA